MPGLHWLITGRIRLYKKLALKYLPYSASTLRGDDGGTVGPFEEQFRTLPEGDPVDFLIYSSGNDLPSASRIYEQCRPGGLVLIDLLNRSSKAVEDVVQRITGAGLEVEMVLYHAFFVRLFSYPLRLLGVRPDPARAPFFLVNLFFNFLQRIESTLHPYVRFMSGDSVLIVARHLQVPQKSLYDLSIVIPAYNEEKRVPVFLDSIRDYFSDREINYEVLVVDDGSSDATLQVSDGHFEGVKGVRLYKNFGKGGAVKEGIRLSRGERILITDADGSTPIGELERLAEWLDRGRDLAIGSRYLKQSKVLVKQPITRRAVSRMGNFLIRILTGLPYRDTQCGFKLFQHGAAHFLFRDLHNLRFGFDFEILKKAKEARFFTEEVPVEWNDVEGSKVRIKDTFHVLMELFFLQFGYLFKFSLAGALNTVLDYAVHNTLIFYLGRGDNLRQTYYQMVGFVFANIFSYLFNSGFTFRSHGSYWKFLLISLVTFALSSLSFFGLNVLLNPQNDLLITNALKLSTTVISLFTNYFGYKLLVFKVE